MNNKTVLISIVLCALMNVMVSVGWAQVGKEASAPKKINVIKSDRAVLYKPDRRLSTTDTSSNSGGITTTPPQPGNTANPNPGETTTTPADPPSSTNEDPQPTKDITKERKGPSNITFSLVSQIESDVEFSGNELLNVFNTIYRDANRNSGYYYYLPASYSLSWLSGTGQYEFNATYSAANENGRGKTTVTAILKPKLGSSEVKFIKELMKLNIKNKPEEQYGITDLIAIPMAQAPEISFSNLGQFGVEAKDISIRAPSDLMHPIYISFTTGRIDDLMGMFFNNIGLYGDVIVYPSGDGMPASIRIPFNLKIDDPHTFGKFELQPSNWRSGWQNKTDYPVLLTRLNIMKRESTGEFKIYTWQMGDREIPERAKVKFDGSLVPVWIDSNPAIIKMWMDYTVKPCVSCNNAVKEKIIKGTSGSRVNSIGVTILAPLEFTKAQLIKLKIRSYQADPNGLSKVNLPTLTISKDGETLSGGQLFIPEGGTPDFEYLIQVYMADGTKYEADSWKKSNDLEVVIGTNQIKEMISHFK